MQTHSAAFWYRAGDDADQSIREHCQMLSQGGTLPALLTVASLKTQGYRVQRVVVQENCAECKGEGRRFVRPKGMSAARFAKMPRAMLAQRECAHCFGLGWISGERIL